MQEYSQYHAAWDDDVHGVLHPLKFKITRAGQPRATTNAAAVFVSGTKELVSIMADRATFLTAESRPQAPENIGSKSQSPRGISAILMDRCRRGGLRQIPAGAPSFF